jgi:hypothetical protein
MTGTGRSGSTYVCRLFQKLGINVSHENDVDCGRFPGSDGISSWYHAFRNPPRPLDSFPMMFDRVVHIVRNPLNVIKSRAKRMIQNDRSIPFLQIIFQDWEQFVEPIANSTMSVYHFVLRHWVRRNSFVGQHAEWTARVEDLSEDPIIAWSLCMASGFGPRCPTMHIFRNATASVSTKTNTDGGLPKGDPITWEALAGWGTQRDKDYVIIAMQMASKFGYQHEYGLAEKLSTARNMSYKCGFENEKEVLANASVMPRHWDCWMLQY